MEAECGSGADTVQPDAAAPDPPRDARARLRGPAAAASIRCSTRPARGRRWATRRTTAATRWSSCRSRPRRSRSAPRWCSSRTCTPTTSTRPRCGCWPGDRPVVVPAAGRRDAARARVHRRAAGGGRRSSSTGCGCHAPPGSTAPGRSPRRWRRCPASCCARRASRPSTSRATRSGATTCAPRIDEHAPDVVVVNASGARFNEGDPIVMTADDVVAIARHARGRMSSPSTSRRSTTASRRARTCAPAFARRAWTSACPRTVPKCQRPARPRADEPEAPAEDRPDRPEVARAGRGPDHDQHQVDRDEGGELGAARGAVALRRARRLGAPGGRDDRGRARRPCARRRRGRAARPARRR